MGNQIVMAIPHSDSKIDIFSDDIIINGVINNNTIFSVKVYSRISIIINIISSYRVILTPF